MNILSKKDFCKVIDVLKQNDEFLDKLNDLFREFDKDDGVYSTGLEDTVVKLLEFIFEDKENQWISYWIWELDYGESYKDGDIIKDDGTIVPLKTAEDLEDLYDCLIKNMTEH